VPATTLFLEDINTLESHMRGGVSYETAKYGHEFYGTWTPE
jgi:hypothetical protein